MPDFTAEQIEAAAHAIWDVYAQSPVAREGTSGMSWVQLCELASKHPDGAPSAIHALALKEAAAALSAAEVLAWRSIGEAPKDGRALLLYWPYWSKDAVVGWWNEAANRWDSICNLSDSEQPTHFRPLSEPPGDDRRID